MNTPSPLTDVSVIASTLNTLNVVSDVTLNIMEFAASARAIVDVTVVQKGMSAVVVSPAPSANAELAAVIELEAAAKPFNCAVGTPKGTEPLAGPRSSNSPVVPPKPAVTGEAGNVARPPAGRS